MPFLQSCFLNDQYSSSFHAIGKQMKIKYLRLAAEELNLTHVRLKQHMCRGHPSKHCAAIIILALSSPGANCSKYFLISAQGLLRNVTLQFHLRGWITTPGIPSKKSRIRQVGFAPPALPLYRGRDISRNCGARTLLLVHRMFPLLSPFGNAYLADIAICVSNKMSSPFWYSLAARQLSRV